MNSVPSDLEIYLALGKIVQAVDPLIKMQVPGISMPKLEKEVNWIKFEYLGEFGAPARHTQLDRMMPFCITCYSRASYVNEEPSQDFVGYLRLAQLYKELLDAKDYLIKSSCIQFQESRMSLMDLRTATFTAKSISTGTTPSLATQAAVILSNAYLITNKD